jgi:hypothetical protein
MKFKDIKQFPKCNSRSTVPFSGLEDNLEHYGRNGLNLNPTFQRGHVWTKEQQSKYLEYIFQGGTSGRDIYFNNPTWGNTYDGETICVDGLQRITAVREFLNNKVKVFGCYYKDFTDRLPEDASFTFNIANLKSEKDVVKWYLDFNAGGTPHSKEEIDRVKSYLSTLE